MKTAYASPLIRIGFTLSLLACGDAPEQTGDAAHATTDAGLDTRSDATADATTISPTAFKEPGPSNTGGFHDQWTDEDRNRDLPLTVWYPTERTSGPTLRYFRGLLQDGTALADAPVADGGPYPVVIFSHGNSGFRGQSYFLTEHLATHGYVVIAPDHIDNTATTFTTERWLNSTIDRPLDVAAVIDAAAAWNADPAHPLFGALDLDTIGSVGHSFGGFTQFAVAGAAFDSFDMYAQCAARGEAQWGGIWAFCDRIVDAETERAEACRPCQAGDPRVDVFVAMAPAYANFFVADALAGINRPVLIMTGTRDDPWSPAYAQAGFFNALQQPDRLLWTMRDGGHYSFSIACAIPALRSLDLFECGDEIIDPLEGFDLINGAVTAFLEQHLRGNASAAAAFAADAICGTPVTVETPDGTVACP